MRGKNTRNFYEFERNNNKIGIKKKKTTTAAAEIGTSSCTLIQNKMAVDPGYINHHVVEKHKN